MEDRQSAMWLRIAFVASRTTTISEKADWLNSTPRAIQDLLKEALVTDEHSDPEHHSATGVPTGVIGLGVRTVLRVIEKTGHEDTARKIREAPEIIGDKIGGLINTLLGKKEK